MDYYGDLNLGNELEINCRGAMVTLAIDTSLLFVVYVFGN